MEALAGDFSLLLLGPRQTGKTTLASACLANIPHGIYDLMETALRQRIERDPALIIREVRAAGGHCFLIDEVQKIPELLDDLQVLIDRDRKQFILTGSSARKLKRKGTNLLPGRVLSYRLDPLIEPEYRALLADGSLERIKRIIKFGELPGVFPLVLQSKDNLATDLLYSYVTAYLEEEVRAESLVRKIGPFSRFLKLAAEESGKIIRLRGLAQDLGIPHQSVEGYFRILEDCLIIEPVDSLTPAGERGKVVKGRRFLFFDSGVANAAAEILGPADFPAEVWGRLFEQWVGLSLLRYFRATGLRGKIFFWREYSGREVDWVVDLHNHWIPLEVKWTTRLRPDHWQHLEYFLKKYPQKADRAYIIYPGERPQQLSESIQALPALGFVDAISGGAAAG
jgi:predicted AAA+ superfamily ATPase